MTRHQTALEARGYSERGAEMQVGVPMHGRTLVHAAVQHTVPTAVSAFAGCSPASTAAVKRNETPTIG
jgi:hypothetical protein